MPLVFFQPSFHLVNLLLRYHSFIVEHARILLQVFKRGTLTRSLTLRRDIFENIVRARHIVKRPLISMVFYILCACTFRQFVRRVLYVEYNGLIAYFSSPPHFLQAAYFVIVQVVGGVAYNAALEVFSIHFTAFIFKAFAVKKRR